MEINEFEKDVTKEYILKKIKDNEHLISVAYIHNNPVGFVIWQDRHKDKSLHCWLAGTVSEYRRLGIFRSLMNYGEIWAKGHKYSRLTVTTRNKFRNMLLFLIKEGYDIVNVSHEEDEKIELEKKI